MLKALATGLVDSVQVVYNLFDQNPEDELFPACRELNIGVIARVPFDEGSLTGTLSRELDVAGAATGATSTSRPRTSARRSTGSTQMLTDRTSRDDAAAGGAALHPEHPAVATVIPGMRRAAACGSQPGA